MSVPSPDIPTKKKTPVWVWLVLGCAVAPLPIIAILAAILFPVFSQAREKARAISCLSNMKQLGVASLMYAQDYDEKFPPANVWVDVTFPYVKNDKIYHCPALPSNEGSGYAMNQAMSKLKLEKLTTSPQTTLLLFESTNLERNATDDGRSRAWRHSNKGNVTYVDGHAKLEPQR